MKNIFIVIAFAVVFFSCEKTVLLDLNQSASRIVIEGQVTNQLGYQYVKISRSVGFYATGDTPGVEDATVLVRDDIGNEFQFIHNPGNLADSIGFYLPEVPFTGEIGRTYKLVVTVDGEGYEAEDELQPVTAIDSLTYRISTDEQEDPKDYGKFYEVLLFAKEPQNTTDFYLFKFYRNDSLKVYDDTDIYYADDEILGENIDGVPSPIYYGPGDIARVEMYSLTRKGYVFYNDLQSLLNNDGGLFGQPPANSRTNLSNGALGYFQASALVMQELEIKE
ncbi:MAG: DUF4249 family protein [Cyclobacteriaceae bacterium]|nr:DUF4249 family protein [Cyclobacteriaceae bacterium]MDH4295347.1 DUF4249 family protein [Cyclobacteriaceae bacterium]